MTPEELRAARDRIVPDVVTGGLRVLFCGINPSLTTAATGHHFAFPGNRFWPVLHRSGFTPRQLKPSEQSELLHYGLGITNVVARATARADELSAEEFLAGGRILTAKVERLRPRLLAVVGITAYRTAFGARTARIGRQDRTIGGAQVWVLPNPSGLNAHWTLDSMAEEYARLRAALADPAGADDTTAPASDAATGAPGAAELPVPGPGSLRRGPS